MTDHFLHGVQVVNVDTGTRPIQSVKSSVIGIVGTAPRADETAFPLNVPVLVSGNRALAAKLLSGVAGPDGDGTLPEALDDIFDQIGATVVVVRVAKGALESDTVANVIGGVDAVTGAYEGVHALLAAESVVGVRPRIVCAPGFTGTLGAGDTANPVATELSGIVDRLRAIAVIEGPNTTDAAAITAAGLYGSKRLYLVDPAVRKANATGALVTVGNSAAVAGVIARSDAERGWWASPSNQNVNGIVGTARPVDFTMGDASSSANLLNEDNVATIIRQNGFRLWGNRTLSADPKWQFVSVVRTADMIAESLQANHLWAVDRGITKTYVEEVREGVRAYLRGLVALGAIVGGDCWLDPELNTPENIAAGKVFWDFDFTPSYPAENLTFRSHLVNNYVQEIF